MPSRKGCPNKARKGTAKAVARTGITPMDFLLSVLRNENNELSVRMQAAKDVAPYVHPRLTAVEHSGPKGGDIIIKLVGADARL